MNTRLHEKIARWTAALRSGEYQQHQGALCDTTMSRHCCLGVYADLFGFAYSPDLDSLLSDVDAAEDDDVFLLLRREKEEGWDVEDHLASLNDLGWSFAEIADEIERLWARCCCWRGLG